MKKGERELQIAVREVLQEKGIRRFDFEYGGRHAKVTFQWKGRRRIVTYSKSPKCDGINTRMTIAQIRKILKDESDYGGPNQGLRNAGEPAA